MADHYCHICYVEFNLESQLLLHLDLKHNWCSLCGRRQFDSQDELVNHQLSQHPFCEICRKYFLSPSNFTHVDFSYPIPYALALDSV